MPYSKKTLNKGEIAEKGRATHPREGGVSQIRVETPPGPYVGWGFYAPPVVRVLLKSDTPDRVWVLPKSAVVPFPPVVPLAAD